VAAVGEKSFYRTSQGNRATPEGREPAAVEGDYPEEGTRRPDGIWKLDDWTLND
jgi:hypothetical protein